MHSLNANEEMKMKYLVCEMEASWDFAYNCEKFDPIRVIQLVHTHDDARILLDKLREIESVDMETGGKRYYSVEQIQNNVEIK